MIASRLNQQGRPTVQKTVSYHEDDLMKPNTGSSNYGTQVSRSRPTSHFRQVTPWWWWLWSGGDILKLTSKRMAPLVTWCTCCGCYTMVDRRCEATAALLNLLAKLTKDTSTLSPNTSMSAHLAVIMVSGEARATNISTMYMSQASPFHRNHRPNFWQKLLLI